MHGNHSAAETRVRIASVESTCADQIVQQLQSPHFSGLIDGGFLAALTVLHETLAAVGVHKQRVVPGADTIGFHRFAVLSIKGHLFSGFQKSLVVPVAFQIQLSGVFHLLFLEQGFVKHAHISLDAPGARNAVNLAVQRGVAEIDVPIQRIILSQILIHGLGHIGVYIAQERHLAVAVGVGRIARRYHLAYLVLAVHAGFHHNKV